MSPDGDTGVARIGGAWTLLFCVCAAMGAAAFLWGVSGGHAQRAWLAYLVNYVYWTGLSFAAVVFAAVLNVTNAKWGRPVKRLAESAGAFLPVSFIMFWVLYGGRTALFYWTTAPPAKKAAWLNTPFMFGRDGGSLLLLTALSLAFVYYSVNADRQWAAGEGREQADSGAWMKSWRSQQVLSPVLIIAYVFVLSLLAFDLIMSLDRDWYSSLFGAYYFIGSFYTAVAALYLFTLLAFRRPGLAGRLRPAQLHDMGKLTMALCLLMGYLFYTQFLVIWYGNLPHEGRYVIERTRLAPWEPLAWTVLLAAFAVPFLVFLSRKVKMKRAPMVALCVLILAAMWLERFLLVVPSVWTGGGAPIGVLEVLITIGFIGIVGLSVITFLRRVPLMPVSDPLFREFIAKPTEELRP